MICEGIMSHQHINEDIRCCLYIVLLKGMNTNFLNILLQQFVSYENILSQTIRELSFFIPKNLAYGIVERRANRYIQKISNWLSLGERHIILYNDADYPVELLNTIDSPLILYLIGNVSLLAYHKIAIVGTSYPSNSGVENALFFARQLSDYGIVIISGVSSGVDEYVHTGTFNGATKSIGILSSGIDIYSSDNNDICSKILANGGLLVSHYNLGVVVSSNALYQLKNRLIAIISSAVLVIESQIDGSAMSIANYAVECDRDVMAIPGSIHDPVYKGCHKLIKAGAKLVDHINDVFEELNLFNQYSISNDILGCIGMQPISISDVSKNLSYTESDLYAILLKLELSGIIINCGNGFYQKNIVKG